MSQFEYLIKTKHTLISTYVFSLFIKLIDRYTIPSILSKPVHRKWILSPLAVGRYNRFVNYSKDTWDLGGKTRRSALFSSRSAGERRGEGSLNVIQLAADTVHAFRIVLIFHRWNSINWNARNHAARRANFSQCACPARSSRSIDCRTRERRREKRCSSPLGSLCTYLGNRTYRERYIKNEIFAHGTLNPG